MSNQIKNIIIFVEVFKTKNFRIAGHSLSMSISTISRAITALEDDFGVTLFLSKNGLFIPTAYAIRLFEETKELTTEISMTYNTLKSRSKYISMLIPPHLNTDALIEAISHYNKRFDKELYLFEHSNFHSRDEPYDAMINGELDIMFDIIPCESNAFFCQKINSFYFVLINSKNSMVDINDKNTLARAAFAQSNWLGESGYILGRHLEIESDLKVGLITQNIRTYYSLIEKTDLIGIHEHLDVNKLQDKFNISDDVFGPVDLYLICSKSAFKRKHEVKWLYEEMLKHGQDYGIIKSY